MRLVSVALDRPVSVFVIVLSIILASGGAISHLADFQEVERALAGLRILSQQAEYQSAALTNANKATQFVSARYRSGLAGLLDVIDSQRTALQAQRQALQVLTSQMLSNVALVNALGGGWDERHIRADWTFGQQ
jgi:outer membrane protein TolC